MDATPVLLWYHDKCKRHAYAKYNGSKRYCIMSVSLYLCNLNKLKLSSQLELKIAASNQLYPLIIVLMDNWMTSTKVALYLSKHARTSQLGRIAAVNL